MRAKFGIALATAAMMASGVAAAQDLRIAPAAPPAHPAYNMYEVLRDGLAEESGGQLKATILGPEVVSLPQMSDALKSGLVDIGNYLPLYFPAEMANFNVGAGFGLTGRDQFVMSMAMTEWAVNCAACQDDFKKAGLVYTSSGSTDVYILLTTKPVRTADDIKGLRLRSGGDPLCTLDGALRRDPGQHVGGRAVRRPESEKRSTAPSARSSISCRTASST